MNQQAAPRVPPPVQMLQLLGGFQVSQALFAVAKLDLATLLEAGPRSVDDIASASGAQTEPLRRLLRSLASLGVFTTVEPGSFALTPLGSTLASATPGSMRDVALMYMETHYGPFGNLLEVVADIGGADGALLSILLGRDPTRRGILFDRPQVVPAASRLLAERGLADRIDVVAGDFFEAVPPADIYIVSRVLHDWDDQSSLRLLANIAAAARPGARLVALEQVVPEGDQPHVSKMVDLTMLVMGSGKERTAKEFEALFATAGFRLDQIVQTPTPMPILEATLTGSLPTRE
jgi:SAM-dependent methyltransferase